MKSAIVTFGRFNPPTIGHGKIVRTMLSHANNEYEPIIFTSIKEKEPNNPLELSFKMELLQTAFPGVRTVLSPKIHDVFSMLLWLRDENYRNVKIVCGSDKYKRYSELLSNYKSTTLFIDTECIGLDREDQVSATKVRKMIRENEDASIYMPDYISKNTQLIQRINKEVILTA